jgi:hypothetical protein
MVPYVHAREPWLTRCFFPYRPVDAWVPGIAGYRPGILYAHLGNGEDGVEEAVSGFTSENDSVVDDVVGDGVVNCYSPG